MRYNIPCYLTKIISMKSMLPKHQQKTLNHHTYHKSLNFEEVDQDIVDKLYEVIFYY